jgi:glycosyltransferase involved in cell wall biosynthesis
MSSNSKISVVIPCYNQGAYLKETLTSVEKSTYDNIEIIIVNDGSTDLVTKKVLEELHTEGYCVLHKENGGLSSARNYGISRANGEFILPLDADDLISKKYIEEGLAVFEAENVDIVYAKAQLFGVYNKPWELPDFSPQAMVKSNIIFCSAIYRKSLWEQVGGYKETMKYGFEDWELWFSMLEKGATVYRIDAIHFYYRVRANSMARTTNVTFKRPALDLIYGYHKDYIVQHMENPLILNGVLSNLEKSYNRIDARLARTICNLFLKGYYKLNSLIKRMF